MIASFTRAYEASADVTPYRIARFSDVAATQKVANASANTQPLIGVFDKMAGVGTSGQMIDVHRSGLCSVELGATVTAGQPLTSDAQGRAIPAVATTATLVRVVGFADQPGVVGDVIDAWIQPGLLDRP